MLAWVSWYLFEIFCNAMKDCFPETVVQNLLIDSGTHLQWQPFPTVVEYPTECSSNWTIQYLQNPIIHNRMHLLDLHHTLSVAAAGRSLIRARVNTAVSYAQTANETSQPCTRGKYLHIDQYIHFKSRNRLSCICIYIGARQDSTGDFRLTTTSPRHCNHRRRLATSNSSTREILNPMWPWHDRSLQLCCFCIHTAHTEARGSTGNFSCRWQIHTGCYGCSFACPVCIHLVCVSLVLLSYSLVNGTPTSAYLVKKKQRPSIRAWVCAYFRTF